MAKYHQRYGFLAISECTLVLVDHYFGRNCLALREDKCVNLYLDWLIMRSVFCLSTNWNFCFVTVSNGGYESVFKSQSGWNFQTILIEMRICFRCTARKHHNTNRRRIRKLSTKSEHGLQLQNVQLVTQQSGSTTTPTHPLPVRNILIHGLWRVHLLLILFSFLLSVPIHHSPFVIILSSPALFSPAFTISEYCCSTLFSVSFFLYPGPG